MVLVTPVQAAVGIGSRVSAARARRVPHSHARVSPVPVSRVLDKVSPLSRASGVLDSSAILSEVPSAGIHSGELRSGEILSEGIHSVEPCSAAASR